MLIAHIRRLALITSLIASPAYAGETVNLLTLPEVSRNPDGLLTIETSKLDRLLDADPATVATFQTDGSAPIDLVFGFDGATVAPQTVTFVLGETNSGRPPERIDILASTISPNTGFVSLRTEPVDPLRKEQKFSFQTSAAKYIRLRLIPAEGEEQISIADLSVLGHRGPPETNYVFGESPAKALEIIKAMESITVLAAGAGARGRGRRRSGTDPGRTGHILKSP